MLKKTLLFVLVMALAITTVMAVGTPSQQSAAINNALVGYATGSATMAEDVVSYYPSAYTVVSLNTKNPESASITVAFSNSANMPESAGASKKTVTLTMKDDGTASNDITGSADPLYAVWNISYGGKLDISLGINSPLKGTGDNEGSTIAWQAIPADGTAVSSGTGSDLQVVSIGTHDGTTSSGITSADNKSITIKTTESASNKQADTYSANLYLLVSDGQ